MASEVGSGSAATLDTWSLPASEAGIRRRLAAAWAPWRRRPLGIIGAVVLVVVLFVAVTAPLIAPNDPRDFVGSRLESPNSKFLLGTNNLGQDVLSRTIFGAQVSIAVALSSTIFGVGLGMILGIVSAYNGGWLDLVIQRVLEILAAFPGLILILMIIAALGRPSSADAENIVLLSWQLRALSIAIGLNFIFGVMRVIRAATLAERALLYVEAAKLNGASTLRIMFRHILPNVFPYVIVAFTSIVGFIILLEAGISFLGYGVALGTPSWGADITGRNRDYLLFAPWILLAPGVALTLTVMSANFLGDTLRDILDPRMRGFR